MSSVSDNQHQYQKSMNDGDVQSIDAWDLLQMSPKSLGSMSYGNFRVQIYPHVDNLRPDADPQKQRFFYAPICLVDHKSATWDLNSVTNQVEMRFRVEMWNEQIQQEAVNFITDFNDQPIKSSRVQVIPFEKVVLFSSLPSKGYTLSKDWTPYGMNRHLWFALTCFSKKEAERLAKAMQTRPEQFSHLKFLFGLSSQTSHTVETVIPIKKIVSRVMAISPNESNEDGRELFLTPTGEKRLLRELTAEIVMEIFYDMDVISTNSEANIYNILKDLLITPRTIHEDQGEIWNSVLWNPEEKCRPDEAARKWNSIWQKLKEDDQIKLLESFNNSNGISMEMDEMFNKLYEESKDTVRWDGKKFVPKPILLSKFNFSNLKHHQSTENPKVDLRYYKGNLWIGMNIAQDSDLMSSDTAFALQKQLKDKKMAIKSLGQELSNKMDAALKTVNDELSAKILSLQAETKISLSKVIFDAYRTSSYSREDSNVSYDGANINVDDSLDLNSGIFTVRTSGIYSFEFYGLSDDRSTTRIRLYADGRVETSTVTGYAWTPVAMGATFKLSSGSKVFVLLHVGNLYDKWDERFTHFRCIRHQL